MARQAEEGKGTSRAVLLGVCLYVVGTRAVGNYMARHGHAMRYYALPYLASIFASRKARLS